MKKIVSGFIGVVILAGIVALVYLGLFAPKSFKTASVSKENIQEMISSSGSLKSNKIETIRCEDALEIQKIFVEVGDRVQKGDSLLSYKVIKTDDNKKANKKEKDVAEEEEELTITAEFKGVVTQLLVEEEAEITAETALMKIAGTNDLYVTTEISQNKIEKISKGQHATISINDNEYTGKVDRISYLALEDSGKPKITVEVTIEDPDDKLILGEEVDVDIYTKFRENVISVPIEAVYSDADNDFVYVIENGMVSRELITAGISSEEFTEVEEGLAVGDMVITDEVSDADRGKEAVSK